MKDLRVRFGTPQGRVEAVRDVSFSVGEGETVALVGESGCGKSVTALSVMRLLDTAAEPDGAVLFRGRDLLKCSAAEMRAVRGRDIAMVFQDPMTSLDPLYTVGEQIGEALRAHEPVSRRQARSRAIDLLREVRLPDAERLVRAYPHELSGGQRQRVMIAIALACEPALLVADEPTTALDVTVEAEILQLLRRLQEKYRMALLLITHDMGVVAEMADRLVVMYAGRIVEQGRPGQAFADARHPYTQALFRSIPQPGTDRDRPLPAIPGAVPRLQEMPDGCRFHPRCPHAEDRCRTAEPPLLDLGGGRRSRCWLREPVLVETGGENA
ncbi:ABC transporter ATP-binding protein [Actinomadura sp. NBRC 104412]|uniref:ABC transporter ATP-binding protein n=1 Tax=Actinomadura sp. NBRC 104412 TaxID=3032203 RepID=UPI002552834D|nr:ABC transporter ATP-binding protein [Actinomadura sp. NBRC 104412]